MSVREQIVEAARDLFEHYGYGKTTMAEIAASCKMSPGNLYRYFPSKLDIAEKIATDRMSALIKEEQKLINNAELTPKDKLLAFLHYGLSKTFALLDGDPKIHEMAQIISHERPEFANVQLAREREIVKKILVEGNLSGEFQVSDVDNVAEMVQCATMKFKYPQLWSALPLDELERELEGVIELILYGLASPRVQNKAAATA